MFEKQIVLKTSIKNNIINLFMFLSSMLALAKLVFSEFNYTLQKNVLVATTDDISSPLKEGVQSL